MWESVDCSISNASSICQFEDKVSPTPTGAPKRRCVNSNFTYITSLNKCYFVMSSKATQTEWDYATNYCSNINSTLVSIHSYTENAILGGQFSKFYSNIYFVL